MNFGQRHLLSARHKNNRRDLIGPRLETVRRMICERLSKSSKQTKKRKQIHLTLAPTLVPTVAQPRDPTQRGSVRKLEYSHTLSKMRAVRSGGVRASKHTVAHRTRQSNHVAGDNQVPPRNPHQGRGLRAQTSQGLRPRAQDEGTSSWRTEQCASRGASREAHQCCVFFSPRE